MNNDSYQTDVPMSAIQRVFIFDSDSSPRELYLSTFGKTEVSCGRADINDIVISSRLASGDHAKFVFDYDSESWYIYDLGSRNGIIHQGRIVQGVLVEEDDFVRIDDISRPLTESVLIIFADRRYAPKWTRISVGSEDGEIELQNLDSTLEDAIIKHNGSRFEFIVPSGARINVNNEPASGIRALGEKDVISTSQCRIVFTSSAIYYNKIKDRPLPKNIPIIPLKRPEELLPQIEPEPPVVEPELTMVEPELTMVEPEPTQMADFGAAPGFVPPATEVPPIENTYMPPVQNVYAPPVQENNYVPPVEENTYIPPVQPEFTIPPIQAPAENNAQVYQEQNNVVQTQNYYQNTNQNYYAQNSGKSTSSAGASFKEFFSSDVGYYVLTFVLAIILWGITIGLLSSDGSAALIVMLPCAYFGWKVLNSIQPEMFLWMTWVGWLIYFCIKFTIAVIIGVFVAPFKLARWIAAFISEMLS